MIRTCPMCGRKEEVDSETVALVCASCGTEFGSSFHADALHDEGLRKVRPPAVALITIGVFLLSIGLLGIVGILGELVFLLIRSSTEGVLAHIASLEFVLRVLNAVLFPILGFQMVLGGRSMRKLSNRRLAMAGAIASLVTVFGTPFGIWSLIVLTRPSVKAAFARQSSV